VKPYGFKKKRPRGDGCFLCTQDRKKTKSAVRGKAKKEDRDEAKEQDGPRRP
jgi:hypothetical protein